MTEGESLVERFDPSHGDWLNIPPVALEKIGRLPYGYVKYRVAFEHHGEQKLFLDTPTEDAKQVFLNGKHVPELSTSQKLASCALEGWMKQGLNVLEISYEAFGSENGNAAMSELKGITAIRLGNEHKSTPMGKVALQRFPAAMKQKAFNPAVMSQVWEKGQAGGAAGPNDLVPAFTWFRVAVPLSGSPEWFAPWKIKIDAARDALIYVNEKFIGYYQTIGPQSEFYLPGPYLHLNGSQQNIVTVILAYTEGLHHLKQIVVSPYMELATRKTKVEFQWD